MEKDEDIFDFKNLVYIIEKQDSLVLNKTLVLSYLHQVWQSLEESISNSPYYRELKIPFDSGLL